MPDKARMECFQYSIIPVSYTHLEREKLAKAEEKLARIEESIRNLG